MDVDRKSITNDPFEEPWWLDIVAPGKWNEIVIKDRTDYSESKIIARLPYVMDNGRIHNPLYTQTLGIWMTDEVRSSQRGNNQFSRQKEIIRDLLRKLPVKKGIDLVLDCKQSYVLPFRWEGYTIEPTFSYRIEDLSDMGSVEARFSKSIKRDINKAVKELQIDYSNESISEFIDLQNLTYKRQSRRNPIDNEFTYSVIAKTIEAGHGKLLMARDAKGKAHAGSFVMFDDRISYHLMSGQDTSYGNDCAMPLLFYSELMFAQKVSKAFDFEGSMVEGIEQVYRRYGGAQVINWHVTKKDLLSECKEIIKPRIKRLIGYKI